MQPFKPIKFKNKINKYSDLRLVVTGNNRRLVTNEIVVRGDDICCDDVIPEVSCDIIK